jgi:hypothetical protein
MRGHKVVEAHLAAAIQNSYDLAEPKGLTKLDAMSTEEVSCKALTMRDLTHAETRVAGRTSQFSDHRIRIVKPNEDYPG